MFYYMGHDKSVDYWIAVLINLLAIQNTVDKRNILFDKSVGRLKFI
jgi:hypothetical protein